MFFTTRGKFIGVVSVLVSVFGVGIVMLALQARLKPSERERSMLIMGYIMSSLAMMILWWIVLCAYWVKKYGSA